MSNKKEEQKIEIINKPADVPAKRSVYIRTLNVMINPMRSRYEKHYKESKKHLVIDIVFVVLILLLIITNVILFNKSFPVESVEIKIVRPKVEGEKIEESQMPEVVQNTNLILSSKIAYYTTEGEQLGVGPWPPVVGETSLIRVMIEVYPTSHRVSNLYFKANLPVGIRWTGNFAVETGEAMVYDETKDLISWSIGSIGDREKVSASFELELTPNEENLGQKMELLKNLSLVGFDLVTSNSVSGFSSNLYTPAVD